MHVLIFRIQFKRALYIHIIYIWGPIMPAKSFIFVCRAKHWLCLYFVVFFPLCCWMFAPLWVVLKKSEKRKFNVADTKNGWCVCLTFFSPSEHFVVTCLLFADVWMRKEHVAWSDDFVPYTFCCIFYLFCVCGTFLFVWVKVRARWGNCTTLCFLPWVFGFYRGPSYVPHLLQEIHRCWL